VSFRGARHEDVWGSEDIRPLIHNVGTRCG